MRAQRQKLRPGQIDKNAYRHPVVRERAPRDMPGRRRPSWAAVNFVLPLRTIDRLTPMAIFWYLVRFLQLMPTKTELASIGFRS
jgi:hypothetical protein